MMEKFFTIYAPIVVSALYFATGLYYAYKKNYSWGIVWVSYAVANTAMVVSALKSLK